MWVIGRVPFGTPHVPRGTIKSAGYVSRAAFSRLTRVAMDAASPIFALHSRAYSRQVCEQNA
jgi:hypothetical protein